MAATHVHFDDTCVLIPDPVVQSRMPRLVKKSYSLPLWRRRSNSNPPLDADAPAPAASPTEEKAGVVFTVSVPSFSRSRSLTPAESCHTELRPCIVSPDAAHPARRAHARRPSLPNPPRPDLATLPLRPCCTECFTITEESLRDAAWPEKFSRAARRRRTSSADRARRVQDAVPGFDAVVSVDEVDKRHGARTIDMSAPAPADDDGALLPSFSRRLQLDEPHSPELPIAEADEDAGPAESSSGSDTGFPLPVHHRAASSALPARDDTPPLLLQDAREEAGDVRATVYYTPDASPALPVPALEPSIGEPASPVPRGAPEPHTPPPPPAKDELFAGLGGAPFACELYAPPAPLTPSHAHSHSHSHSPHTPHTPSHSPVYTHTRYSSSPDSSPELGLSSSPRSISDLSSPGSPNFGLSSSPGSARKRAGAGRHMHAAGSFFRAGAEMLKSVGTFGPGPVPMAM